MNHNQLQCASFTLGQTRFSFGDVVHALNSERPRLVHQQHSVSVELDIQHSPLHPDQGHLQRATPAQCDNIPTPAGSRAQLPGQHFDGRRTTPFHGSFLWFVHNRLRLPNISTPPANVCIKRVLNTEPNTRQDKPEVVPVLSAAINSLPSQNLQSKTIKSLNQNHINYVLFFNRLQNRIVTVSTNCSLK